MFHGTISNDDLQCKWSYTKLDWFDIPLRYILDARLQEVFPCSLKSSRFISCDPLGSFVTNRGWKSLRVTSPFDFGLFIYCRGSSELGGQKKLQAWNNQGTDNFVSPNIFPLKFETKELAFLRHFWGTADVFVPQEKLKSFFSVNKSFLRCDHFDNMLYNLRRSGTFCFQPSTT